MSRRVNAVLLLEDTQHSIFFERVLRRLGYGRRVRPFIAPPGQGAAEQYVRSQYLRQVQWLRSSHCACCLVVAVDADTATVQHRLTQLDRELTTSRVEPRAPGEPIVIFVPKRRIETWIHYLLRGGPVSEDDLMRRLERQGDCHPAADRFAELAKQGNTPEDCPPSLEIALQREAPRIPKSYD